MDSEILQLSDITYIQEMAHLIEELETTNAEGKLLISVGQNLQQLIVGKIDPLKHMFHSGLAEGFYYDYCDKIACSRQLHKYLDGLSYKKPDLTILEIRAGVGALTKHILNPICDQENGVTFNSRFSR